MAFTNDQLETIYSQIRRLQMDHGRLSLVEFDKAEYKQLHEWARRIVRFYEGWWIGRQEKARLLFLAFAMAFIRRHKYTKDNVFWPYFEDALRLDSGSARPLMMDLLWESYQKEGLERKRNKRGREIVGTLTYEMQQAKTWVGEARRQFVEFFKWYYGSHLGEEVSLKLIEVYYQQTRYKLKVLDKVLPTLNRDCQTLARVIDYALDNELYLHGTELNNYRSQLIAGLGKEYDPSRLRLIRNERTLIRLILEFQQHYTPAAFRRELHKSRHAFVKAPWGERLVAHVAATRWKSLEYGIYYIERDEYRVVPHARLRLEEMNSWPDEEIIHWREHLAYKKKQPFTVTIGRHDVAAIVYRRTRKKKAYLWLGKVPVGQKLVIDGRLRSESAGAAWQLSLKLQAGTPKIALFIERLMLYYPDCAHQPLTVRTSNGFCVTDHLREDGVRRFYRHSALVIDLDSKQTSLEVSVAVGDRRVLRHKFQLEPYYLFSATTGEGVQARTMAEIGHKKFLLFVRGMATPQTSRNVMISKLVTPYGPYSVYDVTWQDTTQPFVLRLGAAKWHVARHYEFVPSLGTTPRLPYLALKPHQVHSFNQLGLKLHSTINLLTANLRLEVLDEKGLVISLSLKPFIKSGKSRHLYALDHALWPKLSQSTTSRSARYTFLFWHGETLLADIQVSIIPKVRVKWNAQAIYPEKGTIPVTITTSSPILPAKKSKNRPQNGSQKPERTDTTLWLSPKTQLEPFPAQPTLHRIVPEPISTPFPIPNLGESVEIVLTPRLFGLRLYLRRDDNSYQPIPHADYYALDQIMLYIFSAPNEQIEIKAHNRTIWRKKTDANGDLLIPSLESGISSLLRRACQNTQTEFTVKNGPLNASFTVEWAPILHQIQLQDDIALIDYQGPQHTSVQLTLRDTTGTIYHTSTYACHAHKQTAKVHLPATRHDTSHLVAEYILPNGQTRPAAQPLQVEKTQPLIPTHWLEEGIGLMDSEALLMLL